MLFDDDEPEDDDGEDLFPAGDEAAPADEEIRHELKPPRQQVSLTGHRDVEAKLLELLAANRLGQSLIFTGPAGIGKATLAYRLAKYMFRYKNDADEGGGLFGGFDMAPPAPADSLSVPENDPVAAQVSSGGYPDLLIVEREIDEKGKAKVHDLEKVREITQFFRRTASHEGGWRIAIIDDADTMNRQSQNALLKILEEPPQKSLLILISHRLGALLPTILSRASVFHFKALPDSDIRVFLKRHGGPLTAESENRITAMAEGSIGRAMSYVEGDRPQIIEQALFHFETWPNLDWAQIQVFAELIGARGTEEGGQIAFRDTLLWLASSLVRAKSLSHPLPPELDAPSFRTMLDTLTLGALLDLLEKLRQHFDQAQFANLDKRYMVLQAYVLFAGK